jgi:antitoxin component of MazEF toxin-antitoxin module
MVVGKAARIFGGTRQRRSITNKFKNNRFDRQSSVYIFYSKYKGGLRMSESNTLKRKMKNISNQEDNYSPNNRKPTLEELMSKITPENQHEEVDFGSPQGEELI